MCGHLFTLHRLSLGRAQLVENHLQLTRFLQLLLLADVFVSQMNSTSVNEAAYVGVPMIALPLTGEQQFNADRVSDLSLGTCLVVSADGTVDNKLLSYYYTLTSELLYIS